VVTQVLQDYMSMGEAARRLGVSTVTLRKMIEAQRLEVVQDPLGCRWVLSTSLEGLIAIRAARPGAKRGPKPKERP
jgi:excisionase family DNA binding protein